MNEDALLLRLRAGDSAAWRELVDSMGDRLFRSACIMCANNHDAEDAVQETYLRFAKNLNQFRGESKLYTWLYGILINIVRRRRHIASRFVITDSPPEAEPVYHEPGKDMDTGTASEFLFKALQRLSPEHRDVMVLRYVDQLPVETIAQRLDVNVGTIKSRLFHARQQMSVLLPESLNPFTT